MWFECSLPVCVCVWSCVDLYIHVCVDSMAVYVHVSLHTECWVTVCFVEYVVEYVIIMKKLCLCPSIPKLKSIMTIHIYFTVSLLRYNHKIQEICTQYIKKLNKMASKGTSQYLVWPPFAHLALCLGDCLDVFFSNLLVYYTRLPSVLVLL